jgi:hypothetical protein
MDAMLHKPDHLGEVLRDSVVSEAVNKVSHGRIRQFDWSRRWKKKVEPCLGLPLVRSSVEIGMTLYDERWTWAEGPHAIGRGWLNGQKVVKDKLSWYQPWGRCHYISFFACAIGVLNYPELDWKFLVGYCHMVPVGTVGDEIAVVMDILNFKRMTAEQSVAHAQLVPPHVSEADALSLKLLVKVAAMFSQKFVPKVREVAQGHHS